MVGVSHSVINEKEEDRDSSPVFAAVETEVNEKPKTEMQRVSEKPREELLKDPNKGAEGKGKGQSEAKEEDTQCWEFKRDLQWYGFYHPSKLIVFFFFVSSVIVILVVHYFIVSAYYCY